MDEVVHAALAVVRLSVFIGASGALFAFGVGSVCRWLKWAPITFTVNIHNYYDGASPSHPQRGDEK